MIERDNSHEDSSELLMKSESYDNPLDSAFTFVGALPGLSYSLELKDGAQEKKESILDIGVYVDREKI